MLSALLARLKQGQRTLDFPAVLPALPARYRGRPELDPARCPDDCRACEEVCPTEALTFSAERKEARLDLGRCLFCTECMDACPAGAIRFGNDYRMAATRRGDLVSDGKTLVLASALQAKLRAVFGRSLKLRQVSAGGCNACEADVNVLNTVVFDLGRFGVQFVASPRHADGLLITGPVTRSMELALRKTYAAVPPPKLVIAVGACAISGGPYLNHGQVRNGAAECVPVDLFIPGCPPHPLTILDGLLRLLGRLEAPGARAQGA